jgi:hypothetical protein
LGYDLVKQGPNPNPTVEKVDISKYVLHRKVYGYEKVNGALYILIKINQ